MHDPMTLAFSIRNPFVSQAPLLRGGKPYHPPLIDIWHVDPEKGGSDDSCDWSGRHRPLNPREKALAAAWYELDHVLGNEPFYPHPRLYGHDPHGEGNRSPKRDMELAFYAWRRRGAIRWHPRWHIHHWKITIIPLQHFKRWMWSRCETCGGPFRWGEAPVGRGWGGGRLRWFKGDDAVRHMACAGALPSKEG